MMVLDRAVLALWNHQRQAVQTAWNYFAAASEKAALVQHPTGTGKTGIMAVIASERAQTKPVLIVCPSAALVCQLIKQISRDFWVRIGAPNGWVPETVQQLLPKNTATIAGVLDAAQTPGHRVVIVTTIQALQQIHADPARYGLLQGKFGTILFDEGHREPAPSWARAVRGFNVKTVLFSATPFRNDIKLFDVDLDHVAFLSFKAAVAAHLVRGVEVDPVALPEDLVAFASEVVARRDKAIVAQRFAPESKVIIRAADADRVRELFDAFRQVLAGRPEGVMAVHDSFKKSGQPGAHMLDAVPANLHARDERFLIHQFMLTEGIDDPFCTMLALYDPFTTERQLVQQVGRLIRHPQVGSQAGAALILGCVPNAIERMWRDFELFDDTCVAGGGRPPLRAGHEVMEALVKALPAVDYVDGRFRTRLDLDADVSGELRVPRSALIYEADATFDFTAFQDDVREALYGDDRYEIDGRTVGTGSCFYHLSLKLTQSPFLSEALFQSPSLELTIYAHHGKRLFFYDSAGLWLDDVDGLSARTDANSMRCLLPQGPGNTISQIYLKNTDLGPAAVRSRSQTAISLERSGVLMGEHLNVVTRAAGKIGSDRRAVSFGSSRIRQGESAHVTGDEFFEWTAKIDKELDAAAPCSALFNRYALPIAIPADPRPVNILLDLYDLTNDFVDRAGNKLEVDFEDVCQDVTYDTAGPEDFKYRFDLRLNGATCRVWMAWDRSKEKYWLRSEALSKFKHARNDRITLLQRLNRMQPFRILPASRGTIYVFGRFYALDLDLTKAGGAGDLVSGLLTGVPQLSSLRSEKGKLRRAAATWPATSVFGFIDRSLLPAAAPRPFGDPFPNLVCDDLGPEAADFIAADEGHTSGLPRAVLIAAKGKGGKAGVSASALYDVCGQVAKNLAYLKVDAQELPGTPDAWDDPWTLKKGSVPRLRAGTTSADFREVYAKARANPRAQREFWMVLGGGILSKAALNRAFQAPRPRPHVLQFHHLMLSTYVACQSVGATLKVFCAP